jgi:hypothetical protein
MTTTTPNMNLVLPDVLLTSGPEYANLINAAQSVIDAHDHSSGNGVRITPAGLNISSDLSFQQTSNATNLRTLRFYNNSSITIGAADKGCFYVLNNELYFIDGAGNSLQLTLGGAINLSGTVSLINIKDTNFTIQHAGDTTKQAKFDVSAIPASTTRTFSIPDSGANDTLVTQAATQTLTNKTLSGNIATNLVSGAATITLPTVTSTLATLAGTETFTNKTITGNTAANLKPDGVAVLTLPAVTDTVATLTSTQTLTNKTLSGNIATNLVSGAATITLPTTTGTLATLANAETLTNKTLGQTVVNSGNAIRFNNASDTFYTTLKGGAVAANDVIITLPITTPSAGQFLQSTDTSGTLTWGNPSNTLAIVAANDSNKIFTNADGRYQLCTPTAARTYTLPTTSIPQGDIWTFNNASNFRIQINASGGALVGFIYPGSKTTFVSKIATPTGAADWQAIWNSAGYIRGMLNGSAPSAGALGEQLVSTVTTATNYAASLTTFNATSLALSAGVWEITYQLTTIINGSTPSGGYEMAISANSASYTGTTLGDSRVGVLTPQTLTNSTTTIAAWRLVLSSAATYYAIASGTYSAGTPQYVCRFKAVRTA